MGGEGLLVTSPEVRLSTVLMRGAIERHAVGTDPATAAVASPMRRATEWSGFLVETRSGTALYAKVLDEDFRGRIDVGATAIASRRAGEAGVAPALLEADVEAGVLLFEALTEGWRWARLSDIDTTERLASAVALRLRFQDGAPLGRQRDPFAEIASLAEEARTIGAVLPSDIDWMLRLAGLGRDAIAAAGIDLAPGHGDGIASNHMIHADGTLRLVDFDSAGDMDPLYDLSTLLLEACPFDDGIEAGIEMATGACRRADLARVKLYAAAEDLHRGLWGAVLSKRSRRADVEFFKYAQWRFLRARMGFEDGRFEYWLRTL